MSLNYPQHYTLKTNRKTILKISHVCILCQKSAVHVHHLDWTKTNHETNNLVPVCTGCHGKIHRARNRQLIEIICLILLQLYRKEDKQSQTGTNSFGLSQGKLRRLKKEQKLDSYIRLLSKVEHPSKENIHDAYSMALFGWIN